MQRLMRYATLLGAVGALAACDEGHTIAPRAPGQLLLDIVSGDAQTGTVGTELAPLIVKVTNAGNPVAGQVLNFRVVAGGGSVYGGTEITDDRGLAQERWTLGTRAGEAQQVQVRAVSPNSGTSLVFATYTATAVPGAASRMTIQAGDGQSAVHGTAVPTAPAVLLTDGYGNPVPNEAVHFAVTSGGGTLQGADTVTNGLGVATPRSWTLGAALGKNTISASAASGIAGSPVAFTATATCDCWSLKASMATPRWNEAVASSRGILYAVGGSSNQVSGFSGFTNSMEAYDPVSNAWTSRPPMPTIRYEPATAVLDGMVYVIGGQNSSGVLTTVEAYDPRTNSWGTLAPLTTPRRLAVAFVVDGVLYVAGGLSDVNGAVDLHSMEAYDPEANAWTPRATMPASQVGAVGGVINGVFYAVSGFDRGSSTFVGTTYAYDPKADTWTQRATMPRPRYAGAAAVVNGALYVMGGSDLSGAVSFVDAYDPVRDAWSSRSPMPTARQFLGAAAINGVIYAVGGGATSQTVYAKTEAYQP